MPPVGADPRVGPGLHTRCNGIYKKTHGDKSWLSRIRVFLKSELFLANEPGPAQGLRNRLKFSMAFKAGQNSPLPLAGEAGVRVEKHKRCLNSVSHYADSFFSGDFCQQNRGKKMTKG